MTSSPFTLGLACHYELLTVTGRTTGRPRSTRVRPICYDGQRWLAAPHGPASWVKNARAADQVTLRRHRHWQTFKITEAGPGDRAAVLREYVRLVPVTRPYCTARPQDPASRFTAEAADRDVEECTDCPHQPRAAGVLSGQVPWRPHSDLSSLTRTGSGQT